MPTRMALVTCSAGNIVGRALGERQDHNAPITPTLLTAFTQNGAAMLDAAVITPLSAGPTARLTLMPTLFMATAAGRSSRGTSRGTTDCHAGAVTAEAASSRKMHSSRIAGVTRCCHTSTANAVAISVAKHSPAIRNRRLSAMSAKAPAGIANRNIGSVVATCTRATSTGLGFSPVINHAAAALYIQDPTFETTVAVHMMLNALWRN